MVLKMWTKCKFALCQASYYKLLTEKCIRKFICLKYSLFSRRTRYVSLMKFSWNTIFKWYIFGIFYIVKFNYFSWRPNKVKYRFWNIFDWSLWWRNWKYKYRWYVLNFFSNSGTYPIQGGSVQKGCMSIVSWFMEYMYYLSACNRGLFKNCCCYVLLLPFEKSFEYYD